MKETDPIKHVVLLMLENHAFDEMLGCFQEKYPHLEGINPVGPVRFNVDASGNSYPQTPKTTYCMRLDPKHDLSDVKEQMAQKNGGFIKNFMSHYRFHNPTSQDCHNIMGYYSRGFLPALHSLAEDFTICDHWFSSLPGPTWPNRFFALSGTSSGCVAMPEGDTLSPNLETIEDQTQITIFDRLNEKEKTWKIFYYDFPNSLIFANQRKEENLAHYHSIDAFFSQDTRHSESEFPDFVFIEPKYFGKDQNDAHPPHNIMKTEKLIGDVYNAIRSNESLWATTLLIIAFDEHGGFYDHVSPPPTVPPDDKQAVYDFRQLGIRVPALLVSPWVQRCVDNTIYDHTSVLKYLMEKWDLGSLGARTEQANSIGNALSQAIKREETDTIASIRVPFGELIKSDVKDVGPATSSHQQAIHLLADYINRESIAGELQSFAGTINLLSWLFRIWIGLKAGVGKKLQGMSDWLAAAAMRAQDQRIHQTTSIVNHLIETAKKKNF